LLLRISRVIIFVWLLAVVPGRNLWNMAYIDFPQYYMGGVIARHGAWEALYPVPKPDSLHNPGYITDSTMRPDYEALAKATGVGDAMRFMQPPPAALLFLPMAFLPYKIAAIVWLFLLCLACWWLSVRMGHITTLLWPHARGLALVLPLVFALSPIPYFTVRIGNTSPLVAVCLVEAVLALLRPNSLRALLPLLVAGLLKYAAVILLPMLIIMRHFRLLLATGVATLCICTITLWIGGITPYKHFFYDLLPTFGRSIDGIYNLSLQAVVSRLCPPPYPPRLWQWLLPALECLSLGGVLLALRRRPPATSVPHYAVGAALLLFSWLLIFGPITWEHYLLYFVPFWGAVLGVYRRSKLLAAAAGLAILLQLLPFYYATGTTPLRWAANTAWVGMLLMGLLGAELATCRSRPTEDVAVAPAPAEA